MNAGKRDNRVIDYVSWSRVTVAYASLFAIAQPNKESDFTPGISELHTLIGAGLNGDGWQDFEKLRGVDLNRDGFTIRISTRFQEVMRLSLSRTDTPEINIAVLYLPFTRCYATDSKDEIRRLDVVLYR